jgi:hypothetical protein
VASVFPHHHFVVFELPAGGVFSISIFHEMSSSSGLPLCEDHSGASTENSEAIELLNQPPPGAVVPRSVSISDFNEAIENCGALAFPSPSFSEDELTAERERKEKQVKRKRQVFAFVIVCLLIVGGVIIEKIKS